VLTYLLAADPAPQSQSYLVVFLAALAIALITSAAALEAARRSRRQHKRADELARDLSRINANVRRRLQFLNAISHDLRTPLNGITLQTHIIEHALAIRDDSTLHKSADEIRTAAVLAAKILDALLQYAQTDIEQNTVAEVRLRELVAQVADPFRAAAEEKKIAFMLAVPDDLVVQTDPLKVQRILANLLDNAVKFTHSGTINVRVIPTADPNYIAIEVVDTGPGIPSQHLGRVFEEFYQVDNAARDPRNGLGLGLAVAHRLATHLGGGVHAMSDPPHGSTFTLRLPKTAPPNEPTRTAAPDGEDRLRAAAALI
jgi:signal transduction histidine kinase